MTPRFKNFLSEAGRLVRSGSLHDATAAIQSALGLRAPGRSQGAPNPVRARQDVGDVIDVEARVVDAPGAPARPRGTPVRPESFSDGSFRNECGGRDYKLFEPAREPGRRLPLVVMLHGCTQDPDDFARGTGMNELAREGGFLVLYPAQARRSNPQRCWNWFKHNHQARGRGEPGVIEGMVREVIARHDVDPRRVYVAGLSAGGAMAAILGDAYPELFAAVGVHSGLPSGAANGVPEAFNAMKEGAKANRRWPKTGATPPTIVFHGDADKTVHVVNGERVMEAAGLSGPGTPHRGRAAAGREFTRTVFRDAQGVERAERWTVHGAGHAWSGGRPAGSYTDPTGPDASAEMLRFFLAHPLPAGA